MEVVQVFDDWIDSVRSAPRVEVPVDRPRSGLPSRFESIDFKIEPALGKALERTAEDAGIPLHVVLLGGWSICVARLSGESDLLIGASVHDRRTEGGGPAGASIVPLRIEFSLEQVVVDVLHSAAGALSLAQAFASEYRKAAFSAMTSSAKAEAGPPPLQIAFNFDQKCAPKLTSVLPHAELVLDVAVNSRGEITCTLHYAGNLFDLETVSSYATCLLTLLKAISAASSVAVGDLPLLDAEECAKILELGAGPLRRDQGCSVHQLFEQQVDRTPGAVAVLQGADSITYRELDKEANRLAQHLVSIGVNVDDRVAIYVERGPRLVVAMLAILKAGAAYVPLDPAYPVERLLYMLADSAPAVLVTESDKATDSLALLAASDAQPVVLDFSVATQSWSSASCKRVAPRGLMPSHLAYVLYTSGSTGQPKGVAMPHGPLVNLVRWQLCLPEGGSGLRTLQFAALGFDVAFQEVFTTLCSGGTLVPVDHDTRLSPMRLYQFIVEHRIERLFLPYFALQTLAEGIEQTIGDGSLAPGSGCRVREIITAGEQLRMEPSITRLLQFLPGCRLHNHYGPTESHVVTALTLDGDPAGWPRLPSIGRPIDNARIYLLDEQGALVPRGAVGEIHLAGPVLARGYLARPDLTTDRFVPDSFDPDAKAVMYRTGDLARWRPDQTLEYLGRRDLQVKIRGFRVELGEIEAQLMACAGVKSAGVVVREDVPGDKRLVAYFSPNDAGAPVSIASIRSHLAERLPDYMIPAAYVSMDSLPLSPNGKLDRLRLPSPGQMRPDWAGEYQPPGNATERALCRLMGEALGLEGIGRNDSFFDMGGTSLLAVRLLKAAQREGLGDISTSALFRDPTAAGLAATLEDDGARSLDPVRLLTLARDVREPIAIVAMAARMPGASTVEALWRNLCDGIDSVTRFKTESLDASVPEELRGDALYVPARGVIDDYDKFDAAFFGISPREAELMDPQQRILLELCWECIERAGHIPDATTAPVGVFAGMYNASYYQNNVLAHPELIEKLGAFQVMLGNEKDYIATRVAHRLNLTGPAISVHTACSTSLVAISQAVDSLRAGRCHMALAGGIAITCPVRSGHLYQEGAMLSVDGRTRSFDAQASGTVFSDGAAVVLLKRLSDALADGNPVYAVIRGAAVNNDGGNKASFTAPSSEGQAAVVAMAHADAGVEARSIGYLETHGTATPLGDPIEIEGLTRSFRLSTDETGFCVAGSIKSNLGHTLMAAGAAGVIKAALALQERCIPATVHFQAPNPVIDFASTPFTVSGQTGAWEQEAGSPRRAGVSSFGVGGTNAHVVLEEAPELPASDPATGPQLLVLSARTPAALEQACENLADHLQAYPHENLADVAWTLASGRKRFPHRLAVSADSAQQAIEQLRSRKSSLAPQNAVTSANEFVFLFPGQGCQYLGMGRNLHAAEPAFREAFDACSDLLKDELDLDLRDLVFGDDPAAMLPTAIMQPAIFTFEYALARWWMSQGVQPSAMIGHSVGEFVAATLAGVFELDDALRLVARRGRLMQAQPTGAMLSVRLPIQSLSSQLPESLSLAAENAPGACVVAGPHDAIAAFQAQLESDGVACMPLRTSHAFHSVMMDPVVPLFAEEVAAIQRNPPRIPVVSTATGNWLSADEALSVDYWSGHLRHAVRFSAAISTVLDSPARLLLEVGPRTTLASLSRQQPNLKQLRISAESSLADSVENELQQLLTVAGQLWCRGASIDPAKFDRRTHRRLLRLPTYPFERQRHWVEAAAASVPVQGSISANAVPVALETPMQAASPHAPQQPAPQQPTDRKPHLVARLKEVFEDVAGFDLADADHDANFIELGLDSLMLTQVALQLQKTFAVKITFRQLMGECASLGRLSELLDVQLPREEILPTAETAACLPFVMPMPATNPQSIAGTQFIPSKPTDAAGGDLLRRVIDQQMQLMSQQLALLGSAGLMKIPAAAPVPAAAPPAQPMAALVAPSMVTSLHAVCPAEAEAAPIDEETALAHTHYDIKKAFGAIARIDSAGGIQLGGHQRQRLDAFIQRYLARTPKSRAFTQEHRGHMADPRVVTGFRPLTKEIVYQIVVERSKAAHLWDIDGNEYVDALNGFGTSLFGWQPSFVLEAVKHQLEMGYEIGPQHPLAGEVSRLVCELTGHDRAALCNTGSEAVLGALRIARTVTGRETVVIFSGSYHGINDEVIVRGTKKLRAVPAAPGILRNTAEKVLVLDYGTPESLAIICERAHELAAVLVEPVQSRRPDFQPVEFLKDVRRITAEAGAVLIFDEVITGFRAHPGGTQALFGIKADLATYGKVVGGGYPIGVIAGKREFMDALDGGSWNYGDDSVPTIGVTYFAGTFVRHPLTLAAAKASLEHMKKNGPGLQQRLNERTTAMAEEINAFCADVGAPIRIKHFASMWRTHFDEDHPLRDLLFAMMRSRGIHILDNFPCFFTTAHSEADFQAIIKAYKESVQELQEAEMLPRLATPPKPVMEASRPMVAGARLGRDPEGRPAWYVPNPEQAGKFLKVGA